MVYAGIDLGTTNCAVAWTSPDTDSPVELLPIPQLVAPGEVFAETLLPSALYLAADGEFPPGALDLPWRQGDGRIVGQFAARRGAETLGRLVTSAKSWLSATGSERTAPILPPNAPPEAPRVSPVDASRAYLEHILGAWNHAFPDTPLAPRHVVLTVPASFDEVARQLTEKAAAAAGLPELVLLEEPQAALYAWLESHPDWRETLRPGDLILVIDVGGGTTDFTLIRAAERDGALELERIAVGDHLLLGGDNMDLALAHAVARRLPKLDALQFQSLWQQCRLAKEALLENPARTEAPVTLLGRGSSLIGGTIRGRLERGEVEAILIDGFFPRTSSEEMPVRRRRAALAELGLPYEQDPAVTKHLAQFLRRGGELACPTHVLFNGGVFRARALRERMTEVLNGWLREAGRPPVRVLEGGDLMHAVARGAAWYARLRNEGGLRIRGGIPHSYYIGIEAAMPAVPGLQPPLKALTVVPFGMEEGSQAEVPGREFVLFTGEPAQFRFFVSASRKQDAIGDLLEEIPEELEELAPVEVCLEGEPGGMARVMLEVQVTETGVLELWARGLPGTPWEGRRWKLEFQLRRHASQ
ncbi:MAG: heat-shock protein [Bryobacteraceae bacterium]|nr:MAG: heat-shock protein [Bryobacteraceae bacterium]